MAGLTDLLVQHQVLDQQQSHNVSEYAGQHGVSEAAATVKLGYATDVDIMGAVAASTGMRFFNLETEQVDPLAADAMQPSDMMELEALPVAYNDTGDRLLVAVSSPKHADKQTKVEHAVSQPVEMVLATHGQLVRAIRQMQPDRQVASNSKRANPLGLTTAAEDDVASHGPVESDQDPDVELDALLLELLEHDGSDLHLTVGIPPCMRVNGELQQMGQFPKMVPDTLEKMLKGIMTTKQAQEFDNNLELDMSYSIPGKARFRVNVFQQRDSYGAVMRTIPFEILPLDKLRIPEQVAQFAYLPRGFVLVTGPTGSGKSTTLASLVDLVNRNRASHIMTVEDPIEFLHSHKKSVVNQREVGTDTHGFTAALKHVLRQDPDVILVGELRDLETIQIALTAAETGHLVFGTLHTQDAPQTVDRIVDVFPPHQQEQIRVMLAGALKGVVCQTLVKTADGQGRQAAVEILVANSGIKNLIREGKTHQIYSAIQAGHKDGMIAMDQNLAELVKEGRITYEAALEKANNEAEFRRLSGRG